jgi:ubiquinone/menaquinone biosynthesis C-methylase UbiE
MMATSIEASRKGAWDESYDRNENFVFYPGEEVIRFVSRHLRRRVALDNVIDVLPGAANQRVIDIGCGIGRTLVFGVSMGLDMHGIDLSDSAINVARQWLAKLQYKVPDDKVVAADIRKLPWPDRYFAHAMSDSVLDSMTFEIAQQGVAEIARVTYPGGLFYCSLISGMEAGRKADFGGEEIVASKFEYDTIQSYFNKAKIHRLLEPHFELLSCALHSVIDPDRDILHGRWHVVARRSNW